MDAARGRTARKYGFSCLVCRRKKIRCGGEQPACHNCQRVGAACAYKSSEAVAAGLYAELQKSQGRLRGLEDSVRRLALLDDEADRGRLIGELAGELGQLCRSSPGEAVTSPATFGDCSPEDLPKQGELEEPEISIDEYGELQYFGSTSRFHIRPRLGEIGPRPKPNEDYHRKWLASNSRFHASWERLSYEKLLKGSELDPDSAFTLLQIYWTWQAPLHNCVYRPCFYRDMAMDGPYFSPFLLNVLYAHACRHIKPDDPRFSSYAQGEYFLDKAKLHLVEEIGRHKPRIPTIQGLLILGGRQCAVGKHSEGWLFTGMALTMLKDLGLHLHQLNDSLLENLEPDDLEVRKRLYLSAYAWDKSMSLSLGRPPSLTEMPYSPDCLLDPVGDEEIWRPCYLPEVEDSYPITKSYCTLSFSWFCRLSVLVNETYNTIYSGRLKDLKMEAVSNLETRLRDFYSSLPDSLRGDDIASREFCPPPHIACLNILYHTVLILLYRPFFRWSADPRLSQHSLAVRAKQVCVEEASLVHAFFRAWGRTYRFQKQSYLVSYCVYTASTIELQQIEDPGGGGAAAHERLQTILSMLGTEARQTPGIQRSIAIIRARLESSERSPGRRAVQTQFRHEPAASQPAAYAAGIPSVGAKSTGPAYAGTALPPSLVEDAAVGDHLGAPGRQGLALQYGVPGRVDGIVEDASVPEAAPWMDWSSVNVGGGFVSDVTNWTFYDTVPDMN